MLVQNWLMVFYLTLTSLLYWRYPNQISNRYIEADHEINYIISQTLYSATSIELYPGPIQ